MRKIIILLGITLCLNNISVYAENTTLDKIEDSIFGFQYSGQSTQERLDRIEESVYGQKSNGSESQRISKLQKDMSADLLGKEIPPTEDTFRDLEEPEIVSKGANINYPAINELEQNVFKQEYKDKDINSRLAALEEKTFGKTFNDDFSSRVDRLKAEIMPKSFRNNAIAQSSNEYFYDEFEKLDKNYELSEYNPPSEFSYEKYNARNNEKNRIGRKTTNLTAMENEILNRNYPNDTTVNRLSRLENQMFGTIFNDDEDKERLERLSSAYKAQKSAAKYDSNKFTQNMSTAMQIGTILLMMLACIL